MELTILDNFCNFIQQLSLFTLIAERCPLQQLDIHRFTKNLINRNINHTLNKLQYKSQDYIMISRVPIYKKKLIDIFTRNSNSFTITFTFKILDCTIPKQTCNFVDECRSSRRPLGFLPSECGQIGYNRLITKINRGYGL